MSSPVSDILAALLSQLDHAVLRRVADDDAAQARYELLGEAPDWFVKVFGSADEAASRSLFLGDFIEQIATGLWASGDLEAVPSGPWEEGDQGYFEASAMNLVGEPLLIISAVSDKVAREQRFVQSNHEQVLDRRRILKEIEKKDVLLDCIVHDLSGPVGTLLMNLEYVGQKLGETSTLRPAVDRAMNQTQRQLTMIRSISQLFAGDIAEMESDGEISDGVDIVAVAHEMVDFHRLTAEERKVQFRLVRENPAHSMKVVGREGHHSRVVENLLLNAIRHTSSDGEVAVTVESIDDGGQVEVRIEDNGPGVEPELAAELFKSFSLAGDHVGSSGLGLYFCRIVTEQCGGSIGYRDRDNADDRSGSGSGGACFWFRLPVVGKSSAGGRVPNHEI